MKKMITIRRMTLEDTAYVAAIEESVFSEPWKEHDFANAVSQDNYIYLVAVDDNEVVGYAGCVMACDDADITNIAVKESYRRMGIADKLLEVLEDLSKKQGMCNIFLEVRKSNNGAQSLYESRGYNPIGMRKNFYRNPDEDAILMQKIIINEEN